MELNEYQKQARITANYPKQFNIIYPTLGLTGEAGEVAEKIKKWLRDENGEQMSENRKNEIKKELGDVLWYIASLSFDLGINLEDIAKINLEKLSDRKERNMLSGNGDNR